MVPRQDWVTSRVRLESLFLASYGKPVPPDYLDWRYASKAEGPLLFNVETIEGHAVASYSAFPVNVACHGATWRTGLSMTTMTHPQWRGKKLFEKLAAELYVHMAALGIGFVWGFPNAKSHPHFNAKLGWADIYEIPTMTLDLAAGDPDAVSSDAGVATDNGFDLDYSGSNSDGLLRIQRSNDYLVWRYTANPVHAYTNHVLSQHGCVSSYVVTKPFLDGLDLVDIQTADKEEARVLLAHVVRLAHETGLRHVRCWAPTHHAVHHVLERLGFKNASPVTYCGGRELTEGGAPREWQDYRNWYLQMGDSDVY